MAKRPICFGTQLKPNEAPPAINSAVSFGGCVALAAAGADAAFG